MPERIDDVQPQPKRLNTIERSILESEVVEAIRQVYDPEIPVNVYDLGLIYGIEVGEEADVEVQMTLTSPACPVAESLPLEVQDKAEQVAGVRSVKVELVWDPPFSIDRIPEHIRLELGLL
jgi:FeS assembly SUF system protein